MTVKKTEYVVEAGLICANKGRKFKKGDIIGKEFLPAKNFEILLANGMISKVSKSKTDAES